MKLKIIKPNLNDESEEELIKYYLEQLTESQLIALKIAEEQLESSFDITRTIGFLKWKKEKEKEYKK